MKLAEELSGVQENVSLAKYTTFKIGGPARYFFIARAKEDLIKAIKWAKQKKLPFFILGGGSNVLFSDNGYKGIIIKTQNSKLKVQNYTSKLKTINAEAGTILNDLVKLSVEKSLTGLEWLAGIPGTVGGAIHGNAGAFWKTMADIIESVEVLDTNNLKIKNISAENCQFANKDSVFKHQKNLVILSAKIKLKKGNKKEIKEKIKEYLKYRRKNHPLNFFSAGCAFKNYIPEIKNQKLLKKFPELVEFGKKGRIPAAYLIEKCGLNDKKIGKAQFSEKHANFIINLGGAKASDVLKLIKLAKEKVKNKFGITLEEEIQYIESY